MRSYLKELRENKKMSQQDVADKTNVSRQYYQQIEAGERQQRMEIAFAAKLADVFKVSLSRIIKCEQQWSSEDIAQ